MNSSDSPPISLGGRGEKILLYSEREVFSQDFPTSGEGKEEVWGAQQKRKESEPVFPRILCRSLFSRKKGGTLQRKQPLFLGTVLLLSNTLKKRKGKGGRKDLSWGKAILRFLWPRPGRETTEQIIFPSNLGQSLNHPEEGEKGEGEKKKISP